MLKLAAEPRAGEVPVFTDPSKASFNAAGMKHGRLRTFAPGALGQTVDAWKAGFRQRKTMGDPWQQGGALVVRPDGQVVYSYSSDDPGDRVPIGEVLTALKS